jgi:hypothetical protein
MIDDGHAIHYSAVQRGTPVYAADGTEVGRVHRVMDNYAEHILDGIVVDTSSGRHFVDGPEVTRTAERGVTLAISAEEVEKLPPPEGGVLGSASGRLSRIWKRG